jgi:hypothetical protein
VKKFITWWIWKPLKNWQTSWLQRNWRNRFPGRMWSCGAGFLPFCKKHRRRVRSLLCAKREPERTAVPAGHESPSGAFKPQTGLQSKCRVFSAARSQRFQHAGSMKKGLLAPSDPKAVGLHTKNPSRFAKGFFVFRRFEVAYATSRAGKLSLYPLRDSRRLGSLPENAFFRCATAASRQQQDAVSRYGPYREKSKSGKSADFPDLQI